ncbi:class I SAM-dependent methyltransferase [Acidimicrobiia bacterium EGI L10123]|uniref:class I SAM-dependent methyltransferase n=1 Tax=Salinilacustrithrix flava TaxID=2957203 RepID=UPI003D7C1F16|nr:class I SAM-dependent methyltransferase [Acidimicrobiia bacterium EGI L10123]
MGAPPDQPSTEPTTGGAEGHYFAEAPTARRRPGHIVVDLHGDRFELATDSATFSPRRLDPGTAFLLDAAPAPPPTGTFLDLGCGYGPIALVLARERPDARIVAVDVNERSRELCTRNAEALGCTNVDVRAPDEVDPALRYDLIWSNPPIRIGKDALHDLLLRWLERLTPDGEAVLVMGRNLGADSMQRWLGEQGFPTERLASKRGYRLLRSQRA